MPARDYYEVLGVNRSATAADIRSAHRKLALQYHPDRNKEKTAAARFAEVQQAYEVLSDDDKRKQYDEWIRVGGTTESFASGGGQAGGAGAQGSPWAGGGSGGASGRGQPYGHTRANEQWNSSDSATFESIFGDIFGGGGRGGPRGAGGAGGAGRGSRARRQEHAEYEIAIPLEKIIRGGKHSITIDGQRYELDVPVGAEDGELLSVPGRLDAVVRIHADTHAWLTRDERDLSYDLPLSIVEATLGAAVDAPLPTGGTVSLKIPAGTPSGKKMRIAGKGIPAAGGKPAGDLFVVIQIVPPKEPNDLTKQLLSEIGRASENPRARIAHLRP